MSNLYKFILYTLLGFIMPVTAYADYELIQGHAFHFMPSELYNDSIFKDNRTSTNTLLRISSGAYGFTILSDSQGFGSFALDKRFETQLSARTSVGLTLGVYLMRESYEGLIQEPFDRIIPKLKLEGRSFYALPLLGLNLDYKLTEHFSLSAMATPTFILFGLKLSLPDLLD